MSARYVHGYATEEQERLFAQAEHWRDDVILDGTMLPPGTRLLEVGCGVGAVLGILGQSFPGIELTGVDLEERQVEVARAHLAHLGLRAELRRAEARALPYDDASFDHVWMMWFLEHVDDPLAALREARRVLAPGGNLTAIEVDYNSVWASPTSDALEAVFAAVVRTMDASGRSDTGAGLGTWFVEAGFESVDPGERRLCFSEDELARQSPYVAAVVESTLSTPLERPDASATKLESGLADLRALAGTEGASLGWTLYKAEAVR